MGIKPSPCLPDCPEYTALSWYQNPRLAWWFYDTKVAIMEKLGLMSFFSPARRLKANTAMPCDCLQQKPELFVP